METYKKILSAIMTNGQRLINSMEEQSFLMQQIKANSLLIEADKKELAAVSERIANLEATYRRLEIENQYYLSRTTMFRKIKKPNSSEYYKKLFSMQSEQKFLKQHVESLTAENVELTEQIFHLKQIGEPEALALKGLIEEYVNFGTFVPPETEQKPVIAQEDESEASWKPE